MHGKGFGGGKVILVGEHAVVHGKPAIAAGVHRGVTATASRAERDLLRIAPWGVAVAPDTDGDDPLARAFAAVLSGYHPRPSLRLDAEVSLPAGAGLGCSAALGVAILDAVDHALDVERSRVTLAELAMAWEREFHGTPSGIDNTTAALGGLLRFEHGVRTRALSARRLLHLVVADSGHASETKQMVARVRAGRDADPDTFSRTLRDMGEIVNNAESFIRLGDVASLGIALDENHDILARLGLSTPRIESMCGDARRAGALGAKVTGAGGGGCIVALAEDADHAVRVRRALGPRAFVEEVGRAA
ncbi:MAG: mevalonate kinase [Polyangiales bacterium]